MTLCSCRLLRRRQPAGERRLRRRSRPRPPSPRRPTPSSAATCQDIFDFSGRWEPRDQEQLAFEVGGAVRRVNVQPRRYRLGGRFDRRLADRRSRKSVGFGAAFAAIGAGERAVERRQQRRLGRRRRDRAGERPPQPAKRAEQPALDVGLVGAASNPVGAAGGRQCSARLRQRRQPSRSGGRSLGRRWRLSTAALGAEQPAFGAEQLLLRRPELQQRAGADQDAAEQRHSGGTQFAKGAAERRQRRHVGRGAVGAVEHRPDQRQDRPVVALCAHRRRGARRDHQAGRFGHRLQDRDHHRATRPERSDCQPRFQPTRSA